MFTRANFDYTLEMGCWPEGIIFAGRGRRIVIQNGQAVELKDGSLPNLGQEPESHSLPNQDSPKQLA
jgi:hypothetical protein